MLFDADRLISSLDDLNFIGVWEHEIIQEFPTLKTLLEDYRQHRNVYQHLSLFPEILGVLPLAQGRLFRLALQLIVSCMTLHEMDLLTEEFSQEKSFAAILKHEERAALLVYERIKQFGVENGQ